MARLSLENVTMEYPPLRRSFVRALAGVTKKRPSANFALNDINIDLRDGDRLALMGGNGAGKTTLLSVMAGILSPLSGRVRREGAIETLFSVTAGIDQELSGLANIELHLKRVGIYGDTAERDRAAIRDRSELGEALRNPVHSYSAGMGMRLAFAMAMSTDPDILLIDEYFGAGDPSFQEKARAIMLEKMERSRIVVFASHNIRLLESICNRALILEKGVVQAYGPFDEIMPLYQQIQGGASRPSRQAQLAARQEPLSLPLIAPTPRRAASLQTKRRGGAIKSGACLSLCGSGDAAFFAMAQSLTEGAGQAYIDAPACFLEQGVHPAARVTHLKETPSAEGVILGGFRGLPVFRSPILQGGPVAVMVRDPRDAAAEHWVLQSAVGDQDVEKTLNALDQQNPPHLPVSIAHVHAQYEAMTAVYSYQNVKLFRYESVLSDPEAAARNLADHFKLEVDPDLIGKAAEAFAAVSVQPPLFAAMRPSEQGYIRLALHRTARELGYDEARS